MCKDKVAFPTFAHEWMAVLQRDAPLGRLADMGDHILGLDRVTAYQVSDRRFDCSLMIDKVAYTCAFKKCDTPTIVVDIGTATAGGEAGETEHNVSRNIAVRSE